VNGIGHFQRAAEIAEHCDKYGADPERVALGQLHATLALTAAQADATAFRRELYRANGEELPAAKRAESKTARDAAAAAAFLD
jgi:hypothetical protein